MSIFNKGVDLEDFEKLKAWAEERISFLEGRVQATAGESAEEAKQALASINIVKSEIEPLASTVSAAMEEIEALRLQISSDLQTIESTRDSYLKDAANLKESASNSLAIHKQLEEANGSTMAVVDQVALRLEKVTELLAQAEQIPESIESLKTQTADANAQSESIKSLLSHSLRRKNELDELHKEVFGHDVKDADGNVERIDGLRDRLEKSYDGLSSRLDAFDAEVEETLTRVEGDQLKAREVQKDEFSELIKSGNLKVEEVSDQLKALLPGALAAGLSAAYEKKQQDEAASLSSHEKNFKTSVAGLVVISLIPFAVDVYLLANGATLTAVLKDTPRLIISILPLYFPVLWLAYSANKRLNLSKRLIEEYTHKSVLGKTFSGLSNQIEMLPHESAVREELRTRLLFNVLQVSSENPGKLITDYGKADHPLMDVLEKSAKLSDSVDALAKVPGLTALAKKLADRRDALLREQEMKIEAGLASGDETDSKLGDRV